MRVLLSVVPVLAIVGCVPSPSSIPAPLPGATTLYMPRAIQQAYSKGTRAMDGRPGPNYWQNRARYSISITALPPDRTIRGSEEIVYHNNSPDTLRNPSFKLFMNIHKRTTPRAFPTSEDYLTSGVHIDTLIVNGKPTEWAGVNNAATNARLRLASPLLPHDSLRLSINWHYDMSRRSGREGMIDSTTWFIAYFYPRVAVFDDYNGWDTMYFNDMQEFYSDFNDYDVAITAPANYVVWGTGTLLNPTDVLQPAIADRLTRSFTSDQTINIATKADMAAKTVTKQSRNTWRFHATNIPDMAFAMSDHYVWDGGSVLVDNAANRRASVQAAYNDTAADFHQMVSFGQHSLDWFSHNWPGVAYPYEKSTIVQGFADMEYPMMVNDEAFADTVFARFVAEHEIAHTYFPFYMGINETRYAFMDEGWATTLEYLIGTADLGAERASTFFKQFRVSNWANNPSPLEDLPIVTPADGLTAEAYGDNAYGKAALGYLALRDLLGDAGFRKGLLAYMDRWHGKHPIPWDFFYTFNDATGQNLNWFWNGWFFSHGNINLAVASVTRARDGYSVSIDNIGGMPAPVDLEAVYSDGSHEVIHETPAIWQANPRRAAVTIPTRKTLQSLDLNTGIWMDADSTNNRWTQR